MRILQSVVLLTLTLLVAVAEERGFPATDAYDPGQLVARFNANGGNGRIARIGFHQGFLVTQPQGGGTGTRVWDLATITAPREVANLGTMGAGAHNFGYAEGAVVMSYTNQAIRMDSWRGTPRRVSIYGRWEGGKLYAFPLSIHADDGYLTQSSDRVIPFTDLRDGRIYGSYNPYRETGIIGKPIVIGNLLIVAGQHQAGGVATYDISDLANPRLLDVLPGIGGYEPNVYGDWVVLSNGTAGGGSGLPFGLTFINYADPANLFIEHQILSPAFYDDNQPNPVYGDTRYAQYQDEFMFVGNAKVDLRTMTQVQDFRAPTLFKWEEYPMPFGNFVAIGAFDDGDVHVFCHQGTADTRAPFVTKMNPPPGATDVHVGSRVGFIMPETLDTTSLRNGDTVVVRPVGGTPIDAIISASHDDVINIWPQAPLADDTTYEVVLRAGGIRDVALNALDADISWRFSTGPTLDGGTPSNQAPSVALTAPATGSDYLAPAAIEFAADASDADGSVVRVEFLANGQVVGSDDSAPYSLTWSGVGAGSYGLRARAIDDDGAVATSALVAVTVGDPPPVRGPYGGVAAAVPGTIEAEHYDLGGEGLAFHDSDAVNQGGALRDDGVDVEVGAAASGGHNVGYTADGEWLGYTIAAAAGSYDLDLRVASEAAAPGALRVVIDGAEVGVADVTTTGGWQTWTTLTLGPVDLAAGEHDLRIEFVGALVNLDAIAFRVRTTEPEPAPTPELTAVAVDAYPVIPGQPARLTASVAGGDTGPFEFRWTFGDGSARTDWSASPSIDHTYTAAGHYGLVVQARNADGVTDTFTRGVTVSPQPSAAGGRVGGPIALDAARRRVAVVNPDNDSVSLVDADDLTLRWEVAVGADPRGLSFAPDGRIWVACRGSHEVVVLAPDTGAVVRRVALPYGSGPVQTLADELGRIYVSCESSGRLGRIPAGGSAVDAWLALGPFPRALALAADGRLFVSRFRSATDAGAVYQVDTASFTQLDTIALAVDPGPDGRDNGRGVPGFLAGFGFDRQAGRLWVTANKFNTQRGMHREGTELTHETTVRTMIAPIGLDAGSDLVDLRIDVDNADSAAAITTTPLGDYLLVAVQGNDLLEVIDRFTGQRALRLATGSAPQGVVVDAATERVFVKNFLSRDVSVIDLGPFLRDGVPVSNERPRIATVGSEALASQVLEGKRRFYLAEDPRMGMEGYISCATCHVEGREDGQVWDFTQRGEGLRNTITLLGRRGTGHGRVHWSANFDEIQDFEHDIRSGFSGSGFIADADFTSGTTNQPLGDPKAGLSPELDAIAAYLASLDRVEDSPHRAEDGSLTAAAIAGEAIFKRLDCASCHSGEDFTDSAQGQLHDVGTLTAASGSRLGGDLSGIDTPTLRGLHATAPYFHDGSAATLLDVVRRSGPQHGDMASLSSGEQQELVAYLKQLDGSNTNPGRPQQDPPADDQSPFTGTPVAVGGGTARIEAEDYDRGGEGVAWQDADAVNNGGAYRSDSVDIQATTDAGGGYNVGWITSGEWLEYSVNVAAAGSYRLDLRVARQPTGDGQLHLERAGQDISGAVAVPSTGGWQAWTTVSTTVELAAGTQVLRVAMDADGFNLNWLELTPVDGSDPDPGTGEGAIAEQDGLVVIEAADYDRHDPTTSHAWEPITGLADTAGEALVAAPNVGSNLGDSTAGAHLVYHIDFATTGTWYVWLRGWGTSGTNDSCHVGLDGVPASYGGWGMGGNANTWAWYDRVLGSGTSRRVSVDVASPGVHSLDLWMREDGFRVDQLVLTTDAGWTPTGHGPAVSPRGTDANTAPVVAAGADASIVLGDGLALDGTASDADGDALTVAWSADPATGVNFADATALATTVGFTTDGTYTLTLSVDDGIDRVSDSLVVTVSAPAVSGFAALVNFQPAGSSVPDGYLADTSQLFATHGDHSFGWTTAFDETRDRNNGTAPDQRWDTLNHLQKNGTDRVWEIAVPDGVYQVHLVAGDPSYTDQVNHFDLEGTRLEDPDGQDHFDSYTALVEVTDGRLTLAPASDASNSKVCFIEITRATTNN